jgi:hypothetical protein
MSVRHFGEEKYHLFLPGIEPRLLSWPPRNLLTMSLYRLSYSGSYLTAKEKASEIRDSRCSDSEGNCPVDMGPSSLEHVITRLHGVI